MTGDFMRLRSRAVIIVICAIAASLTFVSSFGLCESKQPEYTVKPGEEFTIELESRPSTGHSWEISQEPDKKVAAFVRKEYVGSDSGRLGAAGVEYFTFRAVAPGRTTIDFRYVRRWEREKPAQSASYDVVVK